MKFFHLIGLIIFACGLVTAGRASADSAAMTVYPDDAYSRPQFDRLTNLATLSGVTIVTPDLRQRHLDFKENRIDPAARNGRDCTRWRFNRQGQSTALAWLTVGEFVRRAPVLVTLRVYNHSVQSINLAAVLPEALWQPGPVNKVRSWLLIGNGRLAPEEERVLTFRMDGAVVLSGNPVPPVPTYPMGAIQIATDGNSVVNGADYELWLSDLTVRYPDPAGLQITTLSTSGTLTAGAPATFNLKIQGTITTQTLDLELRHDPFVLWRIRLTAAERQALAAGGGAGRLTRDIPWYLPPGPATLGLVADGYRVPGGEAAMTIVNDRQPGFPLVERRLDHGRPTPFVDGRPFAWCGYANNDFQPGNVNEFGASGANAMVIYTGADTLPADPLPGEDAAQVANDRLQERVALALAANPEARLVIRVPLDLSPAWVRQHEADGSMTLIRTDLGDLPWESNGFPATSLASAAWRRDQAEALRQLVRYCAAQPWADRVITVWLSHEETEEWFAWAVNNNDFADYSAANQSAWSDWLTSHGQAVVPIPSPAARNPQGADLLPDTAEGRSAARYAQFYSELTAQTMDELARGVKDECDRRLLVGVFYAYLVQCAGEPRQNLAGHNALHELLASPNVDFLAGVPLHDFRQLVGGYSAYISATESILAAGKLYVNENDLFSWIHPYAWYTPYDTADPRGGAIKMHRRELANNAVHGALTQWFALAASWHHDTQLQDDFKKQMDLYRQLLSCNRAPAEQIALVIDDASANWTAPASTLPGVTHKQLLHAIAQTGAPVGVWLLADVDRIPDRVRLIVVAGAAAPRPADAQKLKDLLARGGGTVVVIGPAGLIDPVSGRRDAAAPAALLGLPITVEDQSHTGTQFLLSDNRQVSSIGAVRPRAIATSGTLMRYGDGFLSATERPLAQGGRLVWCGVPPVDTSLWRDWAGAAGVHFYAPAGYTVYASNEVVAVTATQGGVATLNWPMSDRTVREMYGGQTGSGATTDCLFTPGETKLFKLTPPPTQSAANDWLLFP